MTTKLKELNDIQAKMQELALQISDLAEQQDRIISEILISIPPTGSIQLQVGETLVTTYAMEKGEDTFLAEINQPVQTVEDLPEQTPDVPNLEDVAELGKFQQDLAWELILPEDERYFKTCKWLIEGATLEQLEGMQTKLKVRFDPKAFDHLRNLIWYREELLKGKEGAFSLQSILAQNDTTEAEKPIWEDVAKKVK